MRLKTAHKRARSADRRYRQLADRLLAYTCVPAVLDAFCQGLRTPVYDIAQKIPVRGGPGLPVVDEPYDLSGLGPPVIEDLSELGPDELLRRITAVNKIPGYKTANCMILRPMNDDELEDWMDYMVSLEPRTKLFGGVSPDFRAQHPEWMGDGQAAVKHEHVLVSVH